MRVTEFIITIIYLVVCVGIGVYYRRDAVRSRDDYYVAGRGIGPWVNGFALTAVLSSAAAMMGFLGLSYKFGPIILLVGSGIATVYFILAQMLFVGPLRASAKYSTSDFLEARYDSKGIRILTAIIILILFTGYIVPQLRGAGLVGEFILGIPYWQAMVLASLVFIVYVSIGGMWAVSITDFIQGAMMLAVMILVSAAVLMHFGGTGSLIAQVLAVQPGYTQPHPALSKLTYFGYFFAICFPLCAPHVVMRSLTVRSKKVARQSAIIAAVACFFIYYIANYVIPAGGHLLFPGLQNPDMLIIRLIDYFFHPVVIGLFMAGIFAAMMSTVDGMLIAVSAAVSHDIIDRLKPGISEPVLIRIAMVVVWVIGLIAMLLAVNPPAFIGVIVGWLVLGTASAFFFPVFLGIWWRRANKYGAYAGIIGGFVIYVILSVFFKFPMFGEAVISIPASGVLMVLVSLFTPHPSTAEVEFCESLHVPE
ncbi:MAG: sodium:solute symporter family protein [Bacillota bacterium]